MKKAVMILTVLYLLALLPACMARDETVTITLYYTDESSDQVLKETREIKVPNKQIIPKLAIEELLKGPETPGLISTIPTGTKLLDIGVEDKIAIVNLSKDFSGFPGVMAESFAVISIVNTVTDLEGIEKAHILVDGDELIAPSGDPYGALASYDIEKKDNGLNVSTVTLYFPDEQAMYVMPEQRKVPKNESFEQAIVKELMKGPETPGLTKLTVPEEAKLLSVEVKDKIAYVNFSRELTEKHMGGTTGEEMTIIPIVNTLTELPEVNKVQFLVEGKKRKTLAGHIIFDEPFKRREDRIKER